MLANPIPVPTEAVTGELAGVARKADIDMTQIPLGIEDTVRNDDAISPRREVMVKRLERFASSHSTLAVQLSQVLFCFGIDGKPWIAVRLVPIDQFGDLHELGIPIGMLSAGKTLANLASANSSAKTQNPFNSLRLII